MTLTFARNFSTYLARQDQPYAPIETLAISHPRFRETTTYRFTNQPDATRILIENGRFYTHTTMPFSVGIPERSGELSADLGFTLGTLDHDMIEEIDRAIRDPGTPIYVAYRINASASQRPGFVIKLNITDIAATDQQVSATASRADVFNMRFPRWRFEHEKFPGLER